MVYLIVDQVLELKTTPMEFTVDNLWAVYHDRCIELLIVGEVWIETDRDIEELYRLVRRKSGRIKIDIWLHLPDYVLWIATIAHFLK